MVYTTDSTLQGYLTGNRIFRITNRVSDDGKCEFWSNGQATSESSPESGSWEIMTGRLRSAVLDEKSRARGSTAPLVYYLEGFSFIASLIPLSYESDNIRGPETAKTTLDHIVSTVGTAKVTFYSSSDNGPTIKTHLRRMSMMHLIREIARIGDTTNDFIYYLEVFHDSSFIPELRYFSPANAIYETGNPFGGGRDEGRLLAADMELRSFHVYKDRERVKNRVIIRYGGTHGGVAATDSAAATDSTFPEKREAIIRSPMVQDATTADQFAETIKEMYKGTSEGLKWAEATLKEAELFSGDFDAVLGDQVGIEDTASGTEIFQGKFLKFHYMQAGEQLTITLGLPRAEKEETEAIDRLDGQTEQDAAARETMPAIPVAKTARVKLSGNQSINDATLTALSFGAEDADTDSFHDNSTNPSRLTAPVTGYYIVEGGVEFASNATGRRAVQIRKNGSVFYASLMVDACSSDATLLPVSAIVQLNAGDYVEIMVFQNSGGALNAVADSRATRAEIGLLGTT